MRSRNASISCRSRTCSVTAERKYGPTPESQFLILFLNRSVSDIGRSLADAIGLDIDSFPLHHPPFPPHLRVNRVDVLAEDADEEHLHASEKEEGHDQRRDAGRGETAIEENVQHELHEGVEQRDRGEGEAAEGGEAQWDVRERDEAVESLIDQAI